MSDAPAAQSPITQSPITQSPITIPSARYLAPRLFVAGGLPLIGFVLLRPHVHSDAVALAAVMIFPISEIATERVRRGRFEPVGVIALIGIGVGLTGAVLFHGNATLLKLRESVLTGVFGVVCLVSLAAPKPVMFPLARSFSTEGDASKIEEFNAMWDVPGVPSRFRVITSVWGLGLVGEAAVRVTLAFTISTQRFLAISPIVAWTTLAGLLWFTSRFVRRGQRELAGAVDAG